MTNEAQKQGIPTDTTEGHRLRAHVLELRGALEEIRLFAIHGCGAKQKDARGRIFSAIDEKCKAALEATK